ncbi:unnamed protein product, partial [Ectocarpus sp. 8 AP-2014]
MTKISVWNKVTMTEHRNRSRHRQTGCCPAASSHRHLTVRMHTASPNREKVCETPLSEIPRSAGGGTYHSAVSGSPTTAKSTPNRNFFDFFCFFNVFASHRALLCFAGVGQERRQASPPRRKSLPERKNTLR